MSFIPLTASFEERLQAAAPEASFCYNSEGEFTVVPSLKLEPDYIKGSVGAGDAFCAGVLYGAETEMDMGNALKLGACTAAASLSEVSASDGVKTAQEVLKLYEMYGGNRA